jgi:radical SAM superfamily enzyme
MTVMTKFKTINEVLKETYGEKVYRIALNIGCTCLGL